MEQHQQNHKSFLLAYINGLHEQVKSRVSLFADDTALYLAISSQSHDQMLQQDLFTDENGRN